MNRIVNLLLVILLTALLAACNLQDEHALADIPDTTSGIESFMPNAEIVYEEGFSDEPMYDSVDEALNAHENLQLQGGKSPKVKVRTHTFSNGETYTYTTAKGIVFEDDVLRMTTKKLRQAFKEYEKLLKAKEGNALTAQGFAGTRAGQWNCIIYRYFGDYLNCYDDPTRKWPDSTIWIDTNSLNNFSPTDRQKIIDDFADIAARSDLKVKYRTSGIRVILSNIKDGGCNATLGYSPTSNGRMNLGDGCFERQPKHELLHVAGHHHEHQRPGRERYIDVFEENLTELGTRAFAVRENTGQLIGQYDYGSIMHYRLSVNNDSLFVKNTSIGAFRPIGYTGRVGGTDLSRLDIATINARY